MRRFYGLAALGGVAVLALSPSLTWAGRYRVTNLVSDIDGLAEVTDSNLKNPWGIALSASSPFWISNFDTRTATVYSGDHLTMSGYTPIMRSNTVVSIPGPPTGQVAGAGSDFMGDHFIFSTLDGLICGWASGANASIRAQVSGARYNGLAIGTGSDGNHYLWAANTAAGTVDTFDAAYNATTSPGGFVDPNLDPKYSPYNVQLIPSIGLFVTYMDTTDPDDGGVVNIFDTDGNFQYRLATGGTLAAPWGVALAPDNWGPFSGAILVGNFGDGRISAFDIFGTFLDYLRDHEGNPFEFDNLWALSFGNGGSGGDRNALYFTAGINNQADGLLGSIRWKGH